MATISDLPLDIVEQVLIQSDPITVARFSEVCKSFFGLVYRAPDKVLWRSLFLHVPFDDPRNCLTRTGKALAHDAASFDWRGELQKRIRAQTVIRQPNCHRPGELQLILSTLIYMVIYIPPTSLNYGADEVSKNLLWLAREKKMSSFVSYLFDNKTILSDEERRLAAQFHTLYGPSSRDNNQETSESGTDEALRNDGFLRLELAESQAYVYDMRNYSRANNWGPFLQDSSDRVNWRHIKAIHHIMSTHVALLTESGDGGIMRLSPMSLPFCQAQHIEPEGGGRPDDWAGVEGHWKCSFCFIDHRWLISYNLPLVETNAGRDLSMFLKSDFVEIFRYVPVKFMVKKTIPDPDHPTRPRILFQGTVQGIATMSGEVYMTEEEEVRWSFASGEAGNRIWSSEGVQIGALESNYGVLGSWTTVFHEDEDPVAPGPFWLHKVLSDSEEELVDSDSDDD